MDRLFYVVATVGISLISLLELMMMIRAVMSWFVTDEDGKIYSFLCAITEPFITPVRKLLDRFKLFQNIPIDISFLVTFILLAIIEAVLNMLL